MLTSRLKSEASRLCHSAIGSVDSDHSSNYPAAVIPQWIIEKKRDGQALSEEEIRFFIDGYARDEIPDYQMAAMAMAVYFQGMSFEEVTVLTDTMMRSGVLVDTSGISRPTADKHSTGGIGDKVSLILAPLAASCGLGVPMISGRGLGITGGTLDKIESIPGYRTDLSVDEFLATVDACGCSIIGQTADLTPADRKLYALRDVTATVPSIPLISASIMSKKLAEGAQSLVLDVKWGCGAFMKEAAQAHELAHTMVEIGRRMGRNMTALVTDMNQPLGRTAGNAVEVIESIESLQGNGPDDLMEITLALAGHMLLLAGKAESLESARATLQDHIDTGSAFRKLRQMVEMHGGDLSTIDDPGLLPRARIKEPYASPRAGYVEWADAERIGRACAVLGAGRSKVEDSVDPSVGITHLTKIGEQVRKGSPLLVIHANDEAQVTAAIGELDNAFRISESEPDAPTLIVETIR